MDKFYIQKKILKSGVVKEYQTRYTYAPKAHPKTRGAKRVDPEIKLLIRLIKLADHTQLEQIKKILKVPESVTPDYEYFKHYQHLEPQKV